MLGLLIFLHDWLLGFLNFFFVGLTFGLDNIHGGLGFGLVDRFGFDFDLLVNSFDRFLICWLTLVSLWLIDHFDQLVACSSALDQPLAC